MTVLSRQPRAGRQLAAGYVGGEPGNQLSRKAAWRVERLQQREIFWRWLRQKLDIVPEGRVII
jgi:hypothetical protein